MSPRSVRGTLDPKKHKKSTTPKRPAKAPSKPKPKPEPRKHSGGCPTKRTPKSRAKILEAIRMGATYELAANYAGMSYDTLNDWMKADLQFFQAVKEAEGEAALKWLQIIQTAASDGNWTAAAWKLERRYPNQYGRTVSQTEITGKDGGPIPVIRLPDDWGQKDGG